MFNLLKKFQYLIKIDTNTLMMKVVNQSIYRRELRSLQKWFRTSSTHMYIQIIKFYGFFSCSMAATNQTSKQACVCACVCVCVYVVCVYV